MSQYVVTIFDESEEDPFHVLDLPGRSEIGVTYAGRTSNEPHNMRKPAGYYFVRDEHNAKKLAELLASYNPGALVFYGKNIGSVRSMAPITPPTLSYAKFTPEGYLPA